MRRFLLIGLSVLPMLLVAPTGAAAVDVGSPISPGEPAATIGPVDCSAGGVWADLTNAGGGPATFTLQRDNATLATVRLAGHAEPAKRLVSVPAGSLSLVTVRMDGGGYVATQVESTCPSPRFVAHTLGRLPFTGFDGLHLLALAGGVLVIAGGALHARAPRHNGAPLTRLGWRNPTT